MIFVYPAVISDKVDERYITGILKTLERYYLYHIGEAFQHGDLSLAIDKYSVGGSSQYGKMRLEHVSPEEGKIILTEGTGWLLGDLNSTSANISSISDFFRDGLQSLIDIDNYYKNYHRDYFIDAAGNHYKPDIKGINNYIYFEIIEGGLVTDAKYNLERMKEACDAFMNYMSDEAGKQIILDTCIKWPNHFQEAEKFFNNISTYLSRHPFFLKLDNLLSPDHKEFFKNPNLLKSFIYEAKQKIQEDKEAKRDLDKKTSEAEREKKQAERDAGRDKKQDERDARSKADEELKAEEEKNKKYKKDELVKTTVTPMNSTEYNILPEQVTISDVKVTIYEEDGRTYEETRSITIGVKVLPIKLTTNANIYDVLLDDMYSNKIQYFYKANSRWFLKFFFSSPLYRYFKMAYERLFYNAYDTNKNKVDIYKEMLLRHKGFIDASSFVNDPQAPARNYYAAAILILSNFDLGDPEMNFFSNPIKLRRLFSMGWNTFTILNDTENVMLFCSYLESGMCTKIPYAYLFTGKAGDVFKTLDSVKTYTNKVFGHFKKANFNQFFGSLNVKNKRI